LGPSAARSTSGPSRKSNRQGRTNSRSSAAAQEGGETITHQYRNRNWLYRLGALVGVLHQRGARRRVASRSTASRHPSIPRGENRRHTASESRGKRAYVCILWRPRDRAATEMGAVRLAGQHTTPADMSNGAPSTRRKHTRPSNSCAAPGRRSGTVVGVAAVAEGQTRWELRLSTSAG